MRTQPRTRLLLIALVAGLLTGLVAGAGPAQARTKAACGVEGARTTAHGDGTKIAVVRDDTDDLYGGYTGVYVCHGPTGKARGVLSLESLWPTFSHWTIAGRTAAFVLTTTDSACTKYGQPPEVCQPKVSIHAFNAKTGRTLVSQLIATEPLIVVASPQGELAWVLQRAATRELWFARRGLTPVRLASDPAILPTSVLVGAGSAHWITGTVHYADLP